MPAEIPAIRSLTETGDAGVVLYLNADAPNFWSVIQRHALNNLESLYGGGYFYQVIWRGISEKPQIVPATNELGVYMWLHSLGPESTSGHWQGGNLAWETIGIDRLRVVYSPISDLPPNLSMAWNVLETVLRVYPEAREQLTNIETLIESWAYDEATREWWRDQVKRRKEAEERAQAYSRERRGERRGQPPTDGTHAIILNPEQILEHIASLSLGSSEWWHAIFSWYIEYRESRRFTQRQLAELCGYSLSHTKRELSLWRAEHGGTVSNQTK